jgi:phage terminase small subunit
MTESKAKAFPARHARFVAEYLIDFNGAKAAVRAGYSARRAKQTASELLARDEIAAAIAEGQQQLAARATVTVDEVVAALTTVLRANVLDYMRVGPEGEPIADFSEMTREQAAAVSEVTVEDFVDGRGDDARDVKRVRFKLHDKLSAADKLMRHLGGYAPVRIGNAPGETFKTSQAAHEFTDAELVAIALGGRGGAAPEETGAR